MVRFQKKSQQQYIFLTGQTTAGFTLIEVVVVISIITIIATIASYNMHKWLPNIRLKAAARELFSTMQDAKMQAVKYNQERGIVFEPATNKYYACSDPGPDIEWKTLADNTVVKTVNLDNYQSGISYGHGHATSPKPEGGTFPPDNISYSNNVLVFNSRGTGSAGYVYLQHEKKTDSLAIGTGPSGIILLYRWSGDDWK